MNELLVRLVTSLSAGLAYGLTGFGKSSGEKLDTVKLGISLGVSLVAGVVAEFTGWDISTAMQFLGTAGVTVLVENFVKTVVRRNPLKKKKK